MNGELAVTEVVLASNVLTCRWASQLDPQENSAVSGVGAWLLLVLLLAAADGDARDELAAAAGVAASDAIGLLNAAEAWN